MARESLLRLGHDYQTFLRKGAPAPADVPTLAVPPKTLQPPSTPLLRKAIYKAPQQSPISKVLDTFASDSDLSKAADAVASEMGTRVTEAPIPELFRSTSLPPFAAPPPPTITPVAPTPRLDLIGAYVSRAKAQCQNLVVKYSPPWYQQVVAEWDVWWSRDRINKISEKCLPNRNLDALIVEGGLIETRCTIRLLMLAIFSAGWSCLRFADRGPLWRRPTRYPAHPRSFLVVFNRSGRVSC